MHRMLNKLLVFVGCLSVLLTACTEEDTPLASLNGDSFTGGHVELVTSIESASVSASRVATDWDGKGNFTEGDQITLMAFSENSYDPSVRRAQLTNGQWSTDLNWDQLGTGKADFKAYYPAIDANGGLVNFKIPLNQQKRSDYEKADLLFASTTANKGEKVNLNFAHKMSRLTVTLKSNQLSDEVLSRAVLKFPAFNQIKLNTASGELGEIIGKYAEEVTLHHVGGSTYQAVICPQVIYEDWYGSMWLSIQVNGGYYNFSAPKYLDSGEQFTQFEEGKEIKLTINMTGLPSMAGRTVWVEGVNNPPVDTWGWAFVETHTPGLTWNSSYGWYDCNKTQPTNGNKNDFNSDGNLCWAASSSNLIYWWLDRNRENVARYGKFNPEEWKYIDALNCPIFHYYTAHFPNEGQNVAGGINWFFTGRPAGETIKGGGFFKDVIGNKQIVRVGGSDEYSFTRDLKMAFANKEAVELTHEFNMTGFGRTHAITLWGAEFDENDKVCAIYVCDNNDRDNDSERNEFVDKATGKKVVKFGLYRRMIAYRNGLVYMENSQGECKVRITELNFLSAAEEIWEDYFRKNP